MKAEKLQNVICDIVSEMPIDDVEKSQITDLRAQSSKSTKATRRKRS